jgi:hypothetical protein
MVNQIGSTEGQSEEQNNLSNAMYKRPCPGKNNQDVTNLSSHDGWVLQGFTDGNIAIKSHEYKDKNLHAPK